MMRTRPRPMGGVRLEYESEEQSMTVEDFATRRDPDAILRQITEAEQAAGDTRGKLKIFFGYAAGVGKTYAMLQEAHDILEKGFDVAVGYLEPHTRSDTMALAEGLERVPVKKIAHRGITLEEFDLDAALARRPQIMLVDELAHTNAPGCRHRKRYQDIEELLRAGISVFTTVNVQHLEALNDKIAAITYVNVAERIPDRIFDDADFVELVDIEPGDLIERLRAGKIYVPDRANTALSHFFSQKNLASLREVALRRMADRLTRRAEQKGADAGGDAGEDVAAVITPDASNVKVIRAAANLAESLHGTLTALVVSSSEGKKLDAQEAERLRQNVDLAEELGAHVVTLHGEDAASLISQYAVTAGVTQLVVGACPGSRWTAWLRGDLSARLIKLSYSATVNVVPVKDIPSELGSAGVRTAFRLAPGDVAKALASVAVSSVLGYALYSIGFGLAIVPMIYMLVALLFATRADGFFYAVLVAFGSVAFYNFFFTVPRFSFHAYGASASMMFAFMLAGTLVASSLTIRMRRQVRASALRAYRTEVLLESSRELQAAATVGQCLETAAAEIMKILNRPVVMYRKREDGTLSAPRVFDVPGSGGGDAQDDELTAQSEVAVAVWVAANNERAGATTDTLLEASCLYVPIRSKDAVVGVAGLVMEESSEDFGAFEKNLLIAILDECGQAVGQIMSMRERHDMLIKVEKEALRSNLLRAISHDLRTPLTSISGDADMLLREGARLTPDQRRQMYNDIYEDSTWLIDLVENLLSVTRIDDGTVQIARQPELVADVFADALHHVNRRACEHTIVVEVSDELLMAYMDARLIMQVIINLVNNALVYTPAGSRIVVAAKPWVDDGRKLVRISVADDGPGVPDADKASIFDMFYHVSSADSKAARGDSRRGMGLGLPLCRSIVRVHGSEMTVRDAYPHGCVFSFDLEQASVEGLLLDGGSFSEDGLRG